MTNFPMLIMVTVVLTNWVSFPGDIHREGSTNLIHEYQFLTTNRIVYEVMLVTNRLATSTIGIGTNGATRWVDVTPPLPNHPTKE